MYMRVNDELPRSFDDRSLVVADHPLSDVYIYIARFNPFVTRVVTDEEAQALPAKSGPRRLHIVGGKRARGDLNGSNRLQF